MLDPASDSEHASVDVESVCTRFEDEWPSPKETIQEIVAAYPGMEQTLIPLLVPLEWELRWRGGDRPELESYLKMFPDYGAEILDAVAALSEPTTGLDDEIVPLLLRRSGGTELYELFRDAERPLRLLPALAESRAPADFRFACSAVAVSPNDNQSLMLTFPMVPLTPECAISLRARTDGLPATLTAGMPLGELRNEPIPHFAAKFLVGAPWDLIEPEPPCGLTELLRRIRRMGILLSDLHASGNACQEKAPSPIPAFAGHGDLACSSFHAVESTGEIQLVDLFGCWLSHAVGASVSPPRSTDSLLQERNRVQVRDIQFFREQLQLLLTLRMRPAVQSASRWKKSRLQGAEGELAKAADRKPDFSDPSAYWFDVNPLILKAERTLSRRFF